MDGYAVRCADIADDGRGAAGEPAHPRRQQRRSRWQPGTRGAHLHRRAGSRRRRRGRDAGRLRACRRRQRRAHPARCPTPGQWIRRARRRRGRAAHVVLRSGERLDARRAGAGRQHRPGRAAGRAPPARGAVLHRRRTGDARQRGARATCGPARSTTPTASSCARCCCAWAARSPTWASCPTGATPRSRRCASAARSHDLILTSGGVSVGEEDHVKPAVQALGQLDLWQIAIKPGKPFAYGRIGDGAISSACRATRCRASSPSCCWCGPSC